MQLSNEQRFAMSDYLKRQYLYSASWCEKVNKMPDNQLFAVFCRISAKERLAKLNIETKNTKSLDSYTKPKQVDKDICTQLTIWDLLNAKGEQSEGSIHSAV